LDIAKISLRSIDGAWMEKIDSHCVNQYVDYRRIGIIFQ
jgi:hypothetical protein